MREFKKVTKCTCTKTLSSIDWDCNYERGKGCRTVAT